MTTDESQRSRRMAVLLLMATAGCAGEIERSYLERRAAFSTILTNPGPAPGFDLPDLFPGDWALPQGKTEEIHYRSGDLELKAWVFVPESARTSRAPALVYLHPGIAGASERTIRDAKPFLDEGFVVMVPTFRGAGGNPGNFELLMGEVDDASAAIRWLTEQPYVDRSRIYAFGFSLGTARSQMLALMDDLPIRHSAGSGGFLDPDFFERAHGNGLVPFDLTNPEEMALRMLIGNIRWMRRRHYAYVGTADSQYASASTLATVKQEMAGTESLLEIIMVPGDHGTSGAPAMERYLELVRAEIEAR